MKGRWKCWLDFHDWRQIDKANDICIRCHLVNYKGPYEYTFYLTDPDQLAELGLIGCVERAEEKTR